MALSRRALAALFAACALLGAGRILWRHFVVERGVRWSGTDARYAALRPYLDHLREAGYVTDRKLNARPSDTGDAEATARYQQAQYALAPVVLNPAGASEGLVVGNFIDPAAAAGVAAERHLKPLHDFGGGLVLFEASK